MAQRVKRLPPMQETQVRSLGWEVPLEKEMATHSSILAWRIPWMEEPGGLQSMGSQRVGHDWASSHPFTSFHFLFKWSEVKWVKWSEVKSLSHVRLSAIPWTVAYWAPPSMGFFQARILEWIAISFSRGTSRPRAWTQVSRVVSGCFTVWATREHHAQPLKSWKHSL